MSDSIHGLPRRNYKHWLHGQYRGRLLVVPQEYALRCMLLPVYLQRIDCAVRECDSWDEVSESIDLPTVEMYAEYALNDVWYLLSTTHPHLGMPDIRPQGSLPPIDFFRANCVWEPLFLRLHDSDALHAALPKQLMDLAITVDALWGPVCYWPDDALTKISAIAQEMGAELLNGGQVLMDHLMWIEGVLY